MDANEDIWTTTTVELATVQIGTATGDAVVARNNIFSMTAEAEAAVLRPTDSGAWPHPLRAALACRCARINASADLGERYFRMIESANYETLADPTDNGSSLGLEPVVRFMDRVSACPKTATAEDIEALQRASITDADIVRLTELNAFVAYQLRVVAGLALLSGSQA